MWIDSDEVPPSNSIQCWVQLMRVWVERRPSVTGINVNERRQKWRQNLLQTAACWHFLLLLLRPSWWIGYCTMYIFSIKIKSHGAGIFERLAIWHVLIAKDEDLCICQGETLMGNQPGAVDVYILGKGYMLRLHINLLKRVYLFNNFVWNTQFWLLKYQLYNSKLTIWRAGQIDASLVLKLRPPQPLSLAAGGVRAAASN